MDRKSGICFHGLELKGFCSRPSLTYLRRQHGIFKGFGMRYNRVIWNRAIDMSGVSTDSVDWDLIHHIQFVARIRIWCFQMDRKTTNGHSSPKMSVAAYTSRESYLRY